MCVDTGPRGCVVKSLITQRLQVFFLGYGPITCSELMAFAPFSFGRSMIQSDSGSIRVSQRQLADAMT